MEARSVELEILMQLLERLRALEPRLRVATQHLSELDVLMAFAAAALQWNWATWWDGFWMDGFVNGFWIVWMDSWICLELFGYVWDG